MSRNALVVGLNKSCLDGTWTANALILAYSPPAKLWTLRRNLNDLVVFSKILTPQFGWKMIQCSKWISIAVGTLRGETDYVILTHLVFPEALICKPLWPLQVTAFIEYMPDSDEVVAKCIVKDSGPGRMRCLNMKFNPSDTPRFAADNVRFQCRNRGYTSPNLTTWAYCFNHFFGLFKIHHQQHHHQQVKPWNIFVYLWLECLGNWREVWHNCKGVKIWREATQVIRVERSSWMVLSGYWTLTSN